MEEGGEGRKRKQKRGKVSCDDLSWGIMVVHAWGERGGEVGTAGKVLCSSPVSE